MSNTQISQSIDFTFYYYCYYVFIYADEWFYNSIFKKTERATTMYMLVLQLMGMQLHYS